MNFGVAQKVHAFLARSELDGILGLGFAPYVSHNRLLFLSRDANPDYRYEQGDIQVPPYSAQCTLIL
jgi:hypothetical protein